MKSGDVVMTTRPTREQWGTKIQAGRIFVVCSTVCYVRNRNGVHVDDEAGKRRGWKFCIRPDVLEVL